MEHEKIERINELARKKKTVGLTEAELAEQADGTYKPLEKKKVN